MACKQQEQAQVAAKLQEEPWVAVEPLEMLQVVAELQEVKVSGVAK